MKKDWLALCACRERLGYGGDAHSRIEFAMDSYTSHALYSKWMLDWRDTQVRTRTRRKGGGGRHVLNIYKSDRFTKTGSGQTYGKHSQKKTRRFLLLSDTQLTGPPQDHESPGEKTPLFAPFIYKCDHFTKTGSGQT
jgi:hypothetical protein